MNLWSNRIKEDYRLGAVLAVHDGELAAISQLQPAEACASLGSSLEGLSATEAAGRQKKYGPNLVARERKPTIPEEIWNRSRNPLNALLLTLAVV